MSAYPHQEVNFVLLLICVIFSDHCSLITDY